MKRERRWILTSCIAILATTAALKLATLAIAGRVLGAPEPVLGLPFEWFLLLSAALELAVCAFLAGRRVPVQLKGLVLGLLGAEFLAYHAMLWLLRYEGPCHCLGSLWGWLNVRDAWVSETSILIACYLCLAGFLLACFSRDEARLSPKHG